MKTIEFDLRFKRFKIFLNNNNLHNKNFPSSVYSNGCIFWDLDNQLHNPYGGAIKYNNGYIYYYLNGEQYTKEQW